MNHSILFFNARSIVNKIDHLHFLIAIHKPTIICITETWLHSDIPDFFLSLVEYSIYRKDRDTKGGGVCIAILNSIINTPIQTTIGTSEIVAVDVLISSIKLRVLCAYLAPCNSSSPQDFLSALEGLIKTNSNFIILGDFNLPDVNWNLDLFPDKQGYDIFHDFFINNQPIFQLIHFPTRGSNILDLAFTNNEKLFTVLDALPPISSSDHSTIKIDIIINKSSPCKELISDFRNADYTTILSDLSSFNFEFLHDDSLSISQKWTLFETVIRSMIAKYVPRRLISKRRLLWINSNLTTLYRKCKNLKQRSSLKPALCSKFKEARRRLRKEVRLRKAKSHYEDRILMGNNAKNFFRCILTRDSQETRGFYRLYYAMANG